MTKEIYGTFTGEYMVDENDNYYPVSPNYASKSMLLEDDKLRLNIKEDGTYIYKQAYPMAYKRLVGEMAFVGKQPIIIANNKTYNILTSSATYFKLIPGMKVTIRIPLGPATWAAVENTLDKTPNPKTQDYDKELMPD